MRTLSAVARASFAALGALRPESPAVLPLIAAAVAFLAAQGFGRFGFGLVLPAMRDALGLSTGEMGLLAGIGLAAYLVSSTPAGALAARLGSCVVIEIGLLGTAAGLAATGFAHGFLVAALAQAIVGVSAPFAIVPILAFGGRWVRPSFRGRATGMIVAGGGCGLLLAGLLVPWLLSAGGEAGAVGNGDVEAWRRAWWGLAAGVLAAAGVAAVFLRDPPATVRPTSRAVEVSNGGIVGAGTPAGRPGAGIGEVPSESLGRSVYRRADVWRIALVFGLYGVSYIVYGTFFAAHLQRHGLDASTAGRLWSLAGLVAIGSGLLGGTLADRLGPSAALVIMFALQGIGMALLAVGNGIGWFAASAVVYGISLWGFPPAISKACTELVGPRLAPAALGLTATAFALGQAAGPMAAGLLADATGSLAPGLLFGALMDGIGAAVAWWIRRDRPITDA